ncbi:MAG TPA: sugar-binding domain-containing protein [Patescibacteria group bacterium]|nr:sugar-binding domain-containing protein [Patescibacteria group bacterium]
MERIIRLQRKIAPELFGTIEIRYRILRHVQYAGPVGRRALAGMMGIGERIVRAQVDHLKFQGLMDFLPQGMVITLEGQSILDELAEYIRLTRGLASLEAELKERLALNQIVIIPGDSDEDDSVARELGRAAVAVLNQRLRENMVVAVSGGSTMANFAEAVTGAMPSVTVVPARGGLGELVEYQANTIAAVVANKLGGRYRLLHVPDGVSEQALEVFLAQDANHRAVAEMIRRADILVHGIGGAAEMATRRALDDSVVAEIVRRGAIGEALGQYCTPEGKIVYVTSGVGLRLEDLAGIGVVIAIAGGRRKAEAIVAVAGAGAQDVLITDESAARAIQTLINQS